MPTLCRMDRRGMEPRPVRASGGRESHRLTTGATMASLPAILICLVGLAPSVLSQEGGDDVATSGPSSRPTAMQSPSRMPAPTTTTVATTPTVVPAAVKPVIIRARYEQDLIVEIDSNLLDDNETATFEGIMSKYTKDYGLEPELDKPYVNTTCNINTQTILNTVAKSTPKPTIPPQLSPVPSESPTSNILMEDLKAQLTIKPTTAPQSPTTAPQPPSFRPTESTGKGGRFLRPVEKVRYKIIHVPYQRVLQSKKLRIKYSLTWESSHPLNNIGGYPNKFVKFINDHLTRVTDDLRKAGLTQIKSAESVLIQETTPKPTPLPTSTKPTEDPTHVPTPSPTFSMQPTHAPTLHPTQYPSQSPSYIPSTEPTSENESKVETTYEQDFKLSEMINRFDDDRIGFFGSVMEGYTNYYGAKLHPQPLRVTTVCEIMDNKLFTTPKLRLTYKMTWSSNHSKVDEYNDAFIEFINGNLTRVTEDLNRAGLAVVSVSEEVLLQKVTPKPTKEPTSAPTKFPTPLPTRPPSNPPTFSTTFAPTEASTTDKPAPPPLASTPSTPPTSTPTLSTPTVSTLSPSTPPPSTPSASPTVNRDPGGVLSSAAIGAMASGIAAVLVLFVYWVYRRRSRQKDSAFTRNHREGNKRGRDFPNSIGGSNGIPAGSRHERLGGMRQAQAVDDRVDVDIAMDTSAEGISVGDYNYAIGLEPRRSNDLHDVDQIPADESLVSNQSLISRGLSMSSDSAHEDDARDHLADEFDQYKDQNLEKMRAEVEGTVTNVDGMMSRALTKALMDDVEEKDPKELTWGGSRNAIEIEASVLCEMNDWLKRKEGASLDERRGFMQETLNRMVASVRHGYIVPEEASRTVHECAAMLGLQLAENIPENALIVTGMRKTVLTHEMEASFKEFGEIEAVAVSPNKRGFGLVRFRSPKSVLRAIDKFKIAEVVVQDVAVMIRVLKAESRSGTPTIDISRPYPNPTHNPSTDPIPRSSSGAQRPTAMEANHGANLETIGYPGDSFGRSVERPYQSNGRGPGSDAGSGRSGRSRASSRSRR